MPASDARPGRAPIDGGAAPYFDDLPTGTVLHAPGVTLSAGHAALHQAIVGNRLRLALDAELYAAVTGAPGVLAHPMLVSDVAIGQSTAASRRVLGNLFYRGLSGRPVAIGTTLRTTTEVVGRRAASCRRGIVVLRVRTVDERGEGVLDFHRAPLLPARAEQADAADDLAAFGAGVVVSPPAWNLAPLRAEALGPLFADVGQGETVEVEAGETVTGAPELARLTVNMAYTHTDASQGPHGRRLVYGGHVIGIACAHVTRALPDLATILAWESCDHLGPTFEGDRLSTWFEITRRVPLDDGGLVHLRVRSTATGEDGSARDVLDWQLVALMP